MKKLLFTATLALLGCGLSATPSFAHAFGLFTCHRCCHGCCKRSCMTFCCRQYNAFTPVCCGNICCDGCCPFGGFGGPGPGPGYGPPPGPMACGPVDGAPCCDGDLPAGPPVGPAVPATPAKPKAPAATSMAPAFAPVQTASYYPGYGYGYGQAYNYGYAYPYAYGPGSGTGPMIPISFNPAAVPAYWNSGR